MPHIPTRTTTAIAVPLLLAALAGCSSGPAAKPAAHDYGKAETAAALTYVHQSAPMKGASDTDALAFVKVYCESVAKEGVKATNRDDLLIASADMVDAWQKSAARYCPVTMKVAG